MLVSFFSPPAQPALPLLLAPPVSQCLFFGCFSLFSKRNQAAAYSLQSLSAEQKVKKKKKPTQTGLCQPTVATAEQGGLVCTCDPSVSENLASDKRNKKKQKAAAVSLWNVLGVLKETTWPVRNFEGLNRVLLPSQLLLSVYSRSLLKEFACLRPATVFVSSRSLFFFFFFFFAKASSPAWKKAEDVFTVLFSPDLMYLTHSTADKETAGGEKQLDLWK